MFFEYILLLDYASFAILILLIGSILLKKLYTLDSTKIFISLMILTFITTIFDVYSVYFFNDGFELSEMNKNLGAGFNVVYYALRVLTLVIFAVYFYRLTDSLKKLKASKIRMAFFTIPGLVAIALILTNPLHHLIFDVIVVNDRFTFSMELLAPLIFTIVAYYFILGIVNIVRFKYYFTKSQLISLLSIIPFSVIALSFQSTLKLLQTRNFILCDLFSTTLSMILITSTIESSAELIEAKTTLTSFKQLKKRLNKTIDEKIETNILLIDVKNYSDIFNKLNFTESENYIKETCSTLKKQAKQFGCDTYYVDQGLFAVFTTKITSTPEKLAKLFKTGIARFARKEYVPQVKICIIKFPDDFNSLNDLLKFMRNYHTKFSYIDDISLFSNLKQDREFQILNSLDKTLDNALLHNEFLIEYQPIYDNKKKRFTSCEALVRLKTKEFGLIEPKYFIDYALLTGKLIEIDLFVIEEVMYFASKIDFNQLGFDNINVNISIIDLLDNTFYDKVKDLITKYKVKPNTINFEIMEGSDSIDHNIIIDNIKKFNNVGIDFTLDNYGVGYSNIKNFYKAPLAAVKLDKALVNNDINNMKCVLETTINLVKSLGRKIYISGIETKEKLDEFINYDADYIQGYYYSKPVSKYELLDFIRKNNLD